jgi:acetylornithine deacetylase
MTDLLALHRLLVETPSPSGREEPLVDALESWLRALGLAPRRLGRNLVLEAGSGPRGLLLNSHLDTVPACAGWTRAPLAWTREGDRLYGLGANDAKASVTAMIAAFVALAAALRTSASGRLLLALTCDEETGGQGLEAILHQLPAFDAALVGEPTGLQLCIAQKGLLVLNVTSHGEACHVAHADRVHATNAIEVAARDILALRAADLSRPHALLGPVSAHATVIRAGERHNVIPDRCEWTIDLRTTPAYTHDELTALIRAALASEVRVKSDRLRPLATDASSAIVQSCRRARPSAPLVGSATLSDAAHLAHVPVVKVGPGETERSHRADEFVLVRELAEGAAFYENAARDYLELGAPARIPCEANAES